MLLVSVFTNTYTGIVKAEMSVRVQSARLGAATAGRGAARLCFTHETDRVDNRRHSQLDISSLNLFGSMKGLSMDLIISSPQ